MKTNFSRFGKSAVSVVLSALMLLSTVLVNAETVNVNADSVSEAVVSDSAALEKSVDVSADVLSADNNSVSIDASELVAASSDKSVESSKSASAADVASEETAAVTDKSVSVSNSKKSEKVTPNSSGDNYSYPEYYTIRFKNSKNWKNVFFYAWNDQGQKNAKWPGESFWNNTSAGEICTRYLKSSEYGKYDHIIFNNNDGKWSDGTYAETKDQTGETKFDKHYHNKIFDAEAGTWELYDESNYSSSGSSGDLDGKYIIYGTTSEPYNFINSLPIQSNGSRYYVEFNPVVGQNYYFALSGSKLYTNLYTQGENGNNGNWKITYNNSDFYAETNRHNNVNGTDYYFSLFSVNNKAIKTVRIYLNKEYSKNYEIVGNPTDTSGVTVYAKSGTIRESTEFTDKYSELATTTINYSDGSDLTVDYKHWQYTNDNGETKNRLGIATVEKNKEITVTTKLNNSDDYSKYYVKAFCVNGASYNIIDETEALNHQGTGEYSFTYTISDDETGPIEITPIYYYFTTGHENDYITFSVEDFTDDVKALWGDTIACYAYYAGSDDNSNANSTSKPALGGYPGQPMVYINGSYYMQIPKTIANDAEIEGITLNNYIWDDIHSEKVKGITGDLKTKITNKENANCQTYDYDDFIALYKRGASESNKINRIIFNFKYRTYNNDITKTHKDDNNSSYTNKGDWDIGNPLRAYNNGLEFVTGADGNGWDALVDYYDHPVDLFARRIVDKTENLTDEENHYITEDDVLNAAATEKIYVVSNGYEAYYYGSNAAASEKYLGQYATKWYVYKYTGSTYQYLGALPPSAFLTGLASGKDTSVALDGSYTANDDTNKENFLNYSEVAETYKKSDKEFTWADYQKLYNECAGKPVVISYESNIYSAGEYIDSSSHTTQNPGYRVDGRWYYSIPNSATTIWAKAKIQIVDETGKIVQIDGSDFDTFNENTHTGAKTGANAYFTNSVGNGNGKDEVRTGSNSMTEVTANQSDTNYFKFTADDYSVGSDGKYYIFKGWYVNYGSTSYSPVNNPSELYNVDGQKPMDSNVTVVARYQEVDPDEILTVSHKLLSSFNDSTSDNYDKNAPTAHNGTGDPTVTVEIIKDNGATTVYTRTGTDVAVDAVTLARYKDSKDYTIKVTLNTDSTTNTSVVGVYRKTTTTVDEEETSDYLKSGTKDEYGNDLLEPNTGKGSNTDPLNTNTSGVKGNVTISTDTETSTKTSQLVYTYPLQSLYGDDGKLATSSLDYVTDLSSNTLTISHELYSDNTAAPKDSNSPKNHNGDISTLGLTVEIVDKNDKTVTTESGDVVSVTGTGTDTSKSASLTAAVLSKYKNEEEGYQIKITLPATVPTDSNSKVDAVYRQDNSTKTKYTESAEESAEDSTSDDYTGWNVTGEYGDSTVTGAPKTYYYNISDLFDDEDNLKTNEIKFFSDANRYVTFSFKYYDRKMSDTSQPLDIDKEATTISQTIPVTNATNLEEAIGKSIIELRLASTNIAERKINNNIDKYVFWASQEQAVSGIAKEKRPGSTNNYLTNAYHTDYYGRQAVIKNDGDTEAKDNNDYFKEVSSANKTEKWVTYIGTSNPDIEESAAKADPTAVKEVVIWGFNTPQTYEMTFKTENLVRDDDAKLYFATKASSNLRFYYNERVGAAKGNGDIVDGVSDHLSAYGIKQDQNATNVYADKEVKVDGETKYFDGWYELVDGKYIKVSSDPVYGNRVTKAATLIAGYKDAETVVKGITVTANDVEKYVSGETEYVRYTTVLNSYGFDDSDHNFESAAVVYVRLASGVTFTGTVSKLLDYSTGSGTLKDAIIENLNEADSTGNRQAATVNVTITRVNSDAKTVVYAYDVVPTDTGANTANGETPITDSKIRFTNKNRVQFSMNLPVSAVEENGSCSNLLVFAAVKYKDDSATYSNTFTGTDAADGSVYIASDNYVVYQNGAAVK